MIQKTLAPNCYIEKVEKRVMEIFGVERDVIYSKVRRKLQVAPRSLLCFCGMRELERTAVELDKRLEMTQSAVSYAVIFGEKITKERKTLAMVVIHFPKAQNVLQIVSLRKRF